MYGELNTIPNGYGGHPRYSETCATVVVTVQAPPIYSYTYCVSANEAQYLINVRKFTLILGLFILSLNVASDDL